MLKMKIQIFFEQEANTISSIKAQTLLTYLMKYTMQTNIQMQTKFDFKFLKMNRVHVNWLLL